MGVTPTRGGVSLQRHVFTGCTGRQSGMLAGFCDEPRCVHFTQSSQKPVSWSHRSILRAEKSEAGQGQKCAGKQHTWGWPTDLVQRLLFSWCHLACHTHKKELFMWMSAKPGNRRWVHNTPYPGPKPFLPQCSSPPCILRHLWAICIRSSSLKRTYQRRTWPQSQDQRPNLDEGILSTSDDKSSAVPS